MEIKYKNQPPWSKLCGQTVLAMVLGLEIEEVCKILKKPRGGTCNKDLYKVLDMFNIRYRYKICKNLNDVPVNSIIKIGFNESTITHWTLKTTNGYYDPDFGIIKQYNTEAIECISYINLLK